MTPRLKAAFATVFMIAHGTNHAIRSQRYHYIRYRGGGEGLYDTAPSVSPPLLGAPATH
jgi:hypothetical protein